MDDLIRDAMHHALDAEPTPKGLRWRVIDSVPVQRERARALPRPSLQWAGGLVAAMLALAIVAGMVYWRGLNASPVTPLPKMPSDHLLSPEGVTVGPDGTVYVSDFVTGEVFRLRPGGGLVRIAGGGSKSGGLAIDAALHHSAGIAVDRDGTLYVAEVYTGSFIIGNTAFGSILRVNQNGTLATVAQGSEPSDPVGLALDSAGTLYFGEFGGNVGALDERGSPTWIESPVVGGPAPSPGYIAFDAAGDLYIADRAPITAGSPGGCRIIRMSSDRKFSVLAGTGVCGFSGDGGPATKAELNDPNGIAFDSAGNLYFADAFNHRVRRIDRSGVITTVAGTGQVGFSGDGGSAVAARLSYPFGIGIAPGNLLYVADASCPCENPSVAGRIRVVNLATGRISTVADGSTPVVTTA